MIEPIYDLDRTHLTMSVSLWWMLNTGWVRKALVLWNPVLRMEPSGYMGEATDSAICSSVLGHWNTQSRSRRSRWLIVSSRDTEAQSHS